jgi:hypothetical protein
MIWKYKKYINSKQKNSKFFKTFFKRTAKHLNRSLLENNK